MSKRLGRRGFSGAITCAMVAVLVNCVPTSPPPGGTPENPALWCAENSDCISGYCVGDICCDTACDGQCDACNLTGLTGTCSPTPGCDPNMGDNGSKCTYNWECDSNFCADGVCCSSVCNELCKSCNVAGSKGTCVEVPPGQSDPGGPIGCYTACDASGACQIAEPGIGCASGSQCTSRVCKNEICADVTPPGALSWMTVLTGVSTAGTTGYWNLNRILPSTNGHISGGGFKLGGIILGSFNMPECCFDMTWEFDFNEAGFPANISHSFIGNNVFKDHYSWFYLPFRYDDAKFSNYYYSGAPPCNCYEGVATPSWSRQFGYTTIGGERTGMGGHVLINAFPGPQVNWSPVDFGDGVLQSDARTVKYGPSGNVEFNVPAGSLTLGAYIDPVGHFFDLSRTDTTITFAKQDGMGVPVWTKTYSAPVAMGVAPALDHTFDTSGNMYVAFNFNGSADLGNGPLTSTGIHDLGLAKLDVNGNVLWSKHFGTPTFDLQKVRLKPTGSEDMLLVIEFAGTIDFGRGSFTDRPVLAKFDALGSLVWNAPAPSGQYIVRGNEAGEAFVVSSHETVDFGWGPYLSGSEIDGFVVAKYDLCSGAGTCRQDGAACGLNTDCQSGYCVDGVCCDGFCDGSCQACSAALKGGGVDGECGPALAGTDPEGDCKGGLCAPSGGCSMAGNGASCTDGTECSSTFCVDGVCCDDACNGECQACTGLKKGSGIDGECAAIKVGTNPDFECIQGTCNGSNACIYDLGVACTTDANCIDGHCVDGVCCSAACAETCKACVKSKTNFIDGYCTNIPQGTDPDSECAGEMCTGMGSCWIANGGPCDNGPADCISGICIEGACCDSVCTGGCMACSAAKTGLPTDGVCGPIVAGTDPDEECVGSVCSANSSCSPISCGVNSDCPTGKCANGTCTGIWQVYTNSDASCALFLDGRVKCWGANANGQLGLGDTMDRGDTPGEMGANLPFVDLGTGRTVKKLAMGDGHVCALLNGGSVACWGLNSQGQLGRGDSAANIGKNPATMGNNLLLVNLGTGRRAIDIAAGYNHNCAILEGGSLKCWGGNQSGQLGLENNWDYGDYAAYMGDSLPLVNLGTGRTATSVVAGTYSSCAILDNSQVKCWGSNINGNLGLGDSESRGTAPNEMGDFLPPVDLGIGKTALEISMNKSHACARLNDGSVKCWGSNGSGRLGLGDVAARGNEPGEMGDNLPSVNLGSGKIATQISAGGGHSCALLNDSTMKCWGINAYGQLGQGNMNTIGDGLGEMGNSLSPINLGMGKTVLRYSSNRFHTCAILNDGAVKCWGLNGNGQLGLGDLVNRGEQTADMGNNLPAVLLQ